MSDEAYDASLDVLRRLDPKSITKNLSNICRLQPELASDLLASIDTPLKTLHCSKSGKPFLCCDYNRDGDSYRSPFINKYINELNGSIIIDDEDAPKPSDHLRELELFANDSFDIYRDLYYEGGISSVYLWDKEEGNSSIDGKIGFDGVVLLKKTVDESSSWDSIHVFEIENLNSNFSIYRLTSTIILDLSNSKIDSTYLSGNLTRQTEKEIQFKDSASHVANIGSLIEDVETQMRNMLQEVYFGKTTDILTDIRSLDALSQRNEDRAKQENLIQKFENL
ncbi:F-actin-capping protein subunit beta [Pichia californica]|uniref:F-actin-capping protein subunit beta n=1 Tax=Pichia californica TaxID=460514 RepID=A0A9P6WGS0_9ASCO|nr:F-actin-capping protein subunit beta [[Candida] californica]